MYLSSYRLFDGTELDLSIISCIGPINWTDDDGRPGACGDFLITERGKQPRRLSFGVSSLVGAFRFMEAVRAFSESDTEGCPARLAYASLAEEARRMLDIRHSDLVCAWQACHEFRSAA